MVDYNWQVPVLRVLELGTLGHIVVTEENPGLRVQESSFSFRLGLEDWSPSRRKDENEGVRIEAAKSKDNILLGSFYDEISKFIKAFPKDIAALDKRSVLAKVNSHGSGRLSVSWYSFGEEETPRV